MRISVRMTKNIRFGIAAGIVAVSLLGCLAACGYDYERGGGKPATAVSTPKETETSYVDATDAQAPAIVASGWWAKDSFVHYGVKISNSNASYVAHNVQVRVSLFDEAGNLASETTDTVSEIGPGQTVGFTGTAGDGWAPASVEIALVGEGVQWADAAGYADPFTIEHFFEQDKGEFRYELSGEITNNTEDYVSTVDMHALLIDEQGEIVAGYPAEAYKIKSGQTKSFLQTINSAPEHASVELYAQPRS